MQVNLGITFRVQSYSPGLLKTGKCTISISDLEGETDRKIKDSQWGKMVT